MTLTVLIVTYMVGMATHAIAEVLNPESEEGVISNFEDKFLRPDLSTYRRIIIKVYYSFTSLSTVGFGDYHPVSDVERVIASIILMLGVAAFSYIINNFLVIIKHFQEV